MENMKQGVMSDSACHVSLRLCACVGRRIRSCLAMEKFAAQHVRNTAAGALLAIIVSDVIGYKLLSASIRHGDLPWYTADAVIMSIALLEAVVSPVLAVCWPQRRRAILCACAFIPVVTTFALAFAPSLNVATASEFCTSNVAVSPGEAGISSAAAGRLATVVVVCVVNAVCRAGVWVNCVLAMVEHQSHNMSLHYGVVVSVRFLSVLAAPKLVPDDTASWILALVVCAMQLPNVVQLLRIPAELPMDEQLEKNKGTSVSRVLGRGVAIGQMIAMGLITAAFWGYGWHEFDIFKTLHLIVEKRIFMTNQFDLLLYHVVVIVVALLGLVSAKPPLFERVSALKQATVMALFTAVLYLAMTLLLTCERGHVAGLTATNYTQPACSQSCGCAVPASGFAPVCVLDSLTTYLSPCHAGCTGTETLSGITVLRGCTCASSNGVQRATLGACSFLDCNIPYQLVRLVAATALILTVLTLKAQGVTLLREVDPRDRSLAFGLATAVTLVITFICAHAAFLAIQVQACAWFEGGSCQLQGSWFPRAVGGVSCGLAGLGFVINAVCWALVARRKPSPDDVPVATRRSSGDPSS